MEDAYWLSQKEFSDLGITEIHKLFSEYRFITATPSDDFAGTDEIWEHKVTLKRYRIQLKCERGQYNTFGYDCPNLAFETGFGDGPGCLIKCTAEFWMHWVSYDPDDLSRGGTVYVLDVPLLKEQVVVWAKMRPTRPTQKPTRGKHAWNICVPADDVEKSEACIKVIRTGEAKRVHDEKNSKAATV